MVKDPKTGALLFVPTKEEKEIMDLRQEIKDLLKRVEALENLLSIKEGK
jgi:hypothetical protein